MLSRASICMACLQSFLILVPAAFAQAPDETSATFTIEPKFFDCSPKVLRSGQSLTLTLGPLHGRNLAVQRENGEHWNYLVIDGPVPGTTPLMTPDAYEKARRVVLPANVIGDYQGKDTRVFTKPGKYTLYTSDNLESEEPGYRCEIRYAG